MLIGIGLAVAVIVLIDAALRPTVTELAKAKVKNSRNQHHKRRSQ
ncbi:hypothetical protein [Flavonifractor plautii]|nr:hypothetical protein [Flavonifractor plautii]